MHTFTMLSRVHLQNFFFSAVYAFLTPQIPDETTPPIIYSQNVLKAIVYSCILYIRSAVTTLNFPPHSAVCWRKEI